MDGLYDADVLEWSEQQARLLRRHAAGEQLNEAPDSAAPGQDAADFV